MSKKRILAVCGILIFFCLLVSSLGFMPALTAQSSNAASALGMQPSPPPPTATSTDRFEIITFFPFPVTIIPEITVLPTDTDTPIPEMPSITSDPTVTPEPTATIWPTDMPTFEPLITATNTARFEEPQHLLPSPIDETGIPSTGSTPSGTARFQLLDIATDTLSPSETPVPASPEPPQQPDTATAAPSLAATYPPETVMPVETVPPTWVVVPPTAVLPASVTAAPENALPFNTTQLMIAGIAAFVIIDIVMLVILFRNWNRRSRRAG